GRFYVLIGAWTATSTVLVRAIHSAGVGRGIVVASGQERLVRVSEVIARYQRDRRKRDCLFGPAFVRQARAGDIGALCDQRRVMKQVIGSPVFLKNNHHVAEGPGLY